MHKPENRQFDRMRTGSRAARQAVGLTAVLVMIGQACSLLTPSEPPSSPAPQPPRPGGLITVAMPEPKSIDPHKTSDRQGMLVLKQLCEPLVAAQPFTGRLLPGAAESWSFSEDMKTVVFKLRPGVKFHNGRDVEAQDYVFSMNRLASNKDPESKAFLLERVAGYRDLREGRAQTLPGVSAPDAATLQITTDVPFAELPAILSHPSAGSAVPKEEVEKGEGFSVMPVCTGPYALGAPWERGQSLRLVRSPHYHGKNEAFTGGGAGYADELVFRPTGGAQESFALFQNREVQISEVPLESITEAQQVRQRLESTPNGVLAFLGFPVTKPPFDNREFRRALGLAIDRRRIVEDLLAGSRALPSGVLPPAAGPVPEAGACAGAVGSRARADEAREALTASGIDPAATPVKIYLNSGGGHESWLGVVSEQWKTNLGIESSLHSEEWLKYMDLLAEGGVDGPFRLAWPVEFPSPEALLAPVFQANSLDNYSRFENPEFQAALEKARGEADEEARKRAYTEAVEVLCNELPILPMWFAQSHIAFGPAVASAKERRLDIFGDPVLRELGVRS